MGGSDLFTGTLDILILRTTQAEALHGYAIGKALREGSEGVLAVDEGALYPALHRLERKGLLDAAWGRTESGRRAKFYRATEPGRAHLRAEAARWSQFSGAVAVILNGPGR